MNFYNKIVFSYWRGGIDAVASLYIFTPHSHKSIQHMLRPTAFYAAGRTNNLQLPQYIVSESIKMPSPKRGRRYNDLRHIALLW